MGPRLGFPDFLDFHSCHMTGVVAQSTKLRGSGPDQRSVDLCQFVGKVLVRDTVAYIAQRQPDADFGDETEFFHTQQQVTETLGRGGFTYLLPGAEEA